MLRKLIKYEWRSVARQLLPLYGGVLVLSIINHFTMSFGETRPLPNSIFGMSTDLLRVIPLLVYFALCVALFVITIMAIVQRFYKGLLTDEGYLMFTLPVKPWQLIASKGIIATALLVLGGIVGVASVFLLVGTVDFWQEFFQVPWSELFYRASALLPQWPLCVVEGIVLMLVGIGSQLSHVYAAMALGHLGRRHRVALSVVAYIGLDVILTTVSTQLMMLAGHMVPESWMTNMMYNASKFQVSQLFLIGGILLNVVVFAVFFAITRYILANRLNLE